MLESNAVSLRLEAGSQEEGFLTQLYPVPRKPTVVIIRLVLNPRKKLNKT
jgi:hypothetical protein